MTRRRRLRTGLLVTHPHRGRARGVGFLWFTLVAMPVLFFSGAMAVDFTRLIMATRQVALAAEQSAVAGAFEIENTSGRVVADDATVAAAETFDANVSSGALPLAVVASRRVLPTDSSVTVVVTYEVKNLLFMDIFDGGSPEIVLRRSADVCVPGTYAPTGGVCTRPQG